MGAVAYRRTAQPGHIICPCLTETATGIILTGVQQLRPACVSIFPSVLLRQRESGQGSVLYIFLLPRTAVPIILRAFGSAPRQSSLLRLLHPEARASAAYMSAWRSACVFSRQLITCSAGRLHGRFLLTMHRHSLWMMGQLYFWIQAKDVRHTNIAPRRTWTLGRRACNR